MEKLRIVICDENAGDAQGYADICRAICDKDGPPAELKCYTDVGEFLFDMGEDTFTTLVSIMIVDPDSSFAPIPVNFRKAGYDGLILYLTHSKEEKHWLPGYDIGAYNYIFKGNDEKSISRFRTVFKKALDAANRINRQYLVFRSSGVYKQIEIKEVLYFEGIMDHVVRVEHGSGRFEFRSELKKLEDRLSASGFVRPHQSFLVSIDAISTVTTTELTLNDGRQIPIGRSYYPALKAEIERWKV